MRKILNSLSQDYFWDDRLWRKKFSLFLLLICTLSLPACGGRQRLPEAEDGILIYAALNPITKDLQRSILYFNEQHTDVQIEIRDYSDEGGLERLRIELMLGQVPDIMEMHYFGKYGPISGKYTNFITPGVYKESEDEYWMPYQQMAQKGYLEDLWPYIEADPELGRDGLLDAPMKAAEVNGGLYILFQRFCIFTLIGRESVVGDRNSWTMEELLDAFSTMPDDSTIMRFTMTKRDVFFNFLRFALNKYVDIGAGTCSFDSEDFRQLLIFLEQFPDEADPDNAEQKVEVRERVWTGRQMLESLMVTWPQGIGHADAIFGERAAFPGYPTADGSSGNFFYPAYTILAMSANCQNKDAAWSYIRNLVRPRANRMEPLADIRDIPVNLHDFELLIEGELKQMYRNYRKIPDEWNILLYRYNHFDAGPEIALMDLLTDEDIQRYRDLVNNTTQLYWPENDLTDIVWDTIGPYLAGDRNMDDTIALLQNRAQLYVNEQR